MIHVRDLAWRAGRRSVLDAVSFDALPGQMLGLVGPNGSGKSSLLRLIAGLRTPAQGKVVLDGRELASWPRRALARRLAFVEQQPLANAALCVRDVVALGRLPHRGWLSAWSRQDEAALQRALDAVDLAPLQARCWKDLSGGERQRAHIARALAQTPSEILLDEPTNHLDIEHQLKLMRLIQRAGLTSVIALHDLNLAAMFCDRLLVLHEGRIAAQGAPATVLTAGLLARVFGVQARVDISPHHGKSHIHYLT